jgi:hypothetical protein
MIAWNCRVDKQNEASEECVRGNGTPAAEVRALTGFTRVRQESPLNVHIGQGAVSHVQITVDTNLAPFVTTRVQDDTLILGWNGDPFVTHLPAPQVRVTLPHVRAVTLAGLGESEIQAEGASLDVDVESGADVRIDAAVKHLRVSVAGPSEIELKAKVDDLRLSTDFPSKVTLQGSAKVADMFSKKMGKIDARNFTVERGSIELGRDGKVSATYKSAVTVKTIRGSDEVTLYGGAKVTDLSDPDSRDKIIIR